MLFAQIDHKAPYKNTSKVATRKWDIKSFDYNFFIPHPLAAGSFILKLFDIAF